MQEIGDRHVAKRRELSLVGLEIGLIVVSGNDHYAGRISGEDRMRQYPGANERVPQGPAPPVGVTLMRRFAGELALEQIHRPLARKAPRFAVSIRADRRWVSLPI